MDRTPKVARGRKVSAVRVTTASGAVEEQAPYNARELAHVVGFRRRAAQPLRDPRRGRGRRTWR